MKKSFLLFTAAILNVSAFSQELLKRSVVLGSGQQDARAESQLTLGASMSHAGAGGAHRTTTGPGGGRWYNYADSILSLNTSVLGVDNTSLDLWQDTTAIWGYGGTTPSYSLTAGEWTSLGLGFSPVTSAWNNGAVFPSEIAITATDPYTIDSVKVFGFYERNISTPAKVAVVDTLVITLVQGSGSATADLATGLAYSSGTLPSHYGVTSISILSMYHDSLNNRAGKSGGAIAVPWPTPLPVPASQVFKYPLISTDTISTGTIGPDGTLGKSYPRPGRAGDPVISFPVPAGSFAAASISFKSGDNTYPAFPTRDTVRYMGTTGTCKYDAFSPIIYFATDASGTNPAFPPYLVASASDWTMGYFKREGINDASSGGLYIPNWGWTTGGGATASALQYPDIWFHVHCAACVLTSATSLEVKNTSITDDVTAYPNPANDELNVSFSLNKSASVSITLTNMMGQVVATQNMSNVASGKAVFSTSELPTGVYMYTLLANNGERTTGRVVIGH